jgi:hypothetical protein
VSWLPAPTSSLTPSAGIAARKNADAGRGSVDFYDASHGRSDAFTTVIVDALTKFATR